VGDEGVARGRGRVGIKEEKETNQRNLKKKNSLKHKTRQSSIKTLIRVRKRKKERQLWAWTELMAAVVVVAICDLPIRVTCWVGQRQTQADAFDNARKNAKDEEKTTCEYYNNVVVVALSVVFAVEIEIELLWVVWNRNASSRKAQTNGADAAESLRQQQQQVVFIQINSLVE